MFRKILAISLFLSLSIPSAYAQIMYHNSSLKNALVEYLYQYGKEIFYRGTDPQEASFVFQRALVLDCSHQGAQAFLNKLHLKHPEVSVRIWGCAAKEDVASVPDAGDGSVAAAEDMKALSKDYEDAEDQMDALETELQAKDQTAQARDTKPAAEDAGQDEVAYATLAKDQTDLIKIQQGNIDFLKSELAEAKKQLKSGVAESDYLKTQIDIAASGLDAQEQKMAVAAKDEESQDLRQRLNELQEQLALVQKIVDDKNRTIETLERELKSSEAVQ
jgi:hypothetical protein